jgi:FolB domain-containing protein
MNTADYTLTLHDLTLNVVLGVFDFEKEAPQAVNINLTLDFLAMPLACESDQHQHAICYAGLSEHLQNFCHGKIFQMIEHLGLQLALQTKKHLSIPANISLEIFKNPPVDNLRLASFKVSLPWKIQLSR